jgi:hypothetical protein
VSVRLIPESVLGISLLRRGYVAEYVTGKAFLVLEASSQSAAAVMTKLRQRYPSAQTAQVAEESLHWHDQYLGWVCFFRKGKYIGGYANMPDEASAAAASATLAARVPLISIPLSLHRTRLFIYATHAIPVKLHKGS